MVTSFVRIFLLVALGIFLCPKSSATVSHQFYESIYFVKGIRDYDWCSSVADCLHLGVMNFQNNARKGNSTGMATLSGCLFVLVLHILITWLWIVPLFSQLCPGFLCGMTMLYLITVVLSQQPKTFRYPQFQES